MAQVLESQVAGKQLKAEKDGTFTVDVATGKYVKLGGVRFYSFTTALVANSTVTTAPVPSFAITSHATGASKLFISDGAKWQAFAL